MVATRRARLRRARDRHDFCRGALFWHNWRLSAVRLRLRGRSHTQAKPDPGILPGSLNCSVTYTGEVAYPWL